MKKAFRYATVFALSALSACGPKNDKPKSIEESMRPLVKTEQTTPKKTPPVTYSNAEITGIYYSPCSPDIWYVTASYEEGEPGDTLTLDFRDDVALEDTTRFDRECAPQGRFADNEISLFEYDSQTKQITIETENVTYTGKGILDGNFQRLYSNKEIHVSGFHPLRRNSHITAANNISDPFPPNMQLFTRSPQ